MKRFSHNYNDITSMDNLFSSWQEFQKGKSKRKDVLEYEYNLTTNLLSLHKELIHKTYKHGPYIAFNINDPKPRNIHKATVKDRVLHRAIYRILYPYFDTKFINDSYSCRRYKGTHKAVQKFEKYSNKVSKNNTKRCFVLKCDIKKFFDNIDHKILKSILSKYITDTDILNLLSNVIDSFHRKPDKGLPLGNLTSQLLVNIYMNEFDQFIKQKLKVKYYIRYADDFVFIDQDKNYLKNLLPKINQFLGQNLKLHLHPNKVSIETLSSGVDFLGFVHFPHYRILRTVTKKRMFRKLEENNYKKESVDSYLGLLSWGDCYGLGRDVNGRS